MRKRVVFLHPDGIAQIVGVLLNPDKVPQTTAESFMLRGRSIPFCSLVKVTARAVYYKEPMIPASYSFDAAQQ